MLKTFFLKLEQNSTLMKVIYGILLLFFVADLAFSFQQFRYFALEGDFSTIIIPSDSYKIAMENPLGWQVLSHPDGYAQPNRYFEFKVMMEYFKHVPLLLQNFFTPIGSLYFSVAILKLITQFGLIYLIGLFLTGKWSIFNKRNILIYTLCFPFFQTWGYQERMAIIDPSITYAFCYATSTILVILFYLPFVLKYFHNYTFKFGGLWYVIFFLYSIFINLNASLNAPIILVVSLITFLGYGMLYAKKHTGNFIKNTVIGIFKTIPKPIFYIFIWGSLTALYSLYIGTFNLENNWETLSISERYLRLPIGIYKQFLGNPGLKMLTITIGIQILLFYVKHPEKNKYSKFILAALIFMAIYLLLLPLGGYRSYRPYIVRRDTFIPVLLLLLALFSFLSYKNWTILNSYFKLIHTVWISYILIFFTINDKDIIRQNDCEIRSLIKISESNAPVVELDEDCTVMGWVLVDNPVYSNYNMMLLYHYGIINNIDQRYIHKSTKK